MIANTINPWCSDNDLALNLKTENWRTFLCNARDNPFYPELPINNADIGQVEKFTYLGTFITYWLYFTENTIKTSKKAWQRLHIISKLRHLGVTENLNTTCHKSFVESVITYHFVVFYNQFNADSQWKLKSVTKTSEYLSGYSTFTPIDELYANKLRTKSLCMIAGLRLLSNHQILCPDSCQMF